MIKKPITYTDYDGNERTEDFYFNLSMAEFTKMELGEVGGFRNYIRRIIAAENVPELTKCFDDLILASYGEKSPDGKRFIKIDKDGHRLSDDFKQTEAYSKLFMELMTDSDKAAEFVNGIAPADVAKKAAELKNDPEILALNAKLGN